MKSKILFAFLVLALAAMACQLPTPPGSATPVPAAQPTVTSLAPSIGGTDALGGITKSGPCPTDREMQTAFGFTTRNIKPVNTSVVSEGDVCKWTLQASHAFTFEDVPFVVDWQIDVTLPDESVVVYYGDGKTRDINGATFRYVPAYAPDHWVRDPERLMAHEFNFGYSQGRDPRYVTINGNLKAPLWDNYDGSSCPENVVQLAGLVGGEPQYWTWKDWDGGAHVYKAPRETFHLLTAAEVPGMNAWIDYWNGQKNAADILDNWNALALSDASYHCHAK